MSDRAKANFFAEVEARVAGGAKVELTPAQTAAVTKAQQAFQEKQAKLREEEQATPGLAEIRRIAAALKTAEYLVSLRSTVQSDEERRVLEDLLEAQRRSAVNPEQERILLETNTPTAERWRAVFGSGMSEDTRINTGGSGSKAKTPRERVAELGLTVEYLVRATGMSREMVEQTLNGGESVDARRSINTVANTDVFARPGGGENA